MIATLPHELRELFHTTEKLHCSVTYENRPYKAIDMERMALGDLSRRIAHEIAHKADLRHDFQGYGSSIRASVYAFNEAELAVLLTRAFEQGRRYR